DLHAARPPIADQVQTGQVVAGNRLLEPYHAKLLVQTTGEGQRLLAAESAVGIDEEFDLVADRLARRAHAFQVVFGMAADFHFDAQNALRGPTAELFL